MAQKNPASKRRHLNQDQPPYEIWIDSSGWAYLVVKKNQAPDKEAANPYAIWNVACVTPHERDLYGHDAYAVEIKRGSELVWIDPAYKAEMEAMGLHLSPTYTLADTSPAGWRRYLA